MDGNVKAAETLVKSKNKKQENFIDGPVLQNQENPYMKKGDNDILKLGIDF
jgi:hypothetical protein